MKGRVTTLLSACPIRARPDDTSEMVSQLLFGESATILKIKDEWAQVAQEFDGYQGWMDKKQLTPSTAKSSKTALSLDLFEHIFGDNRSTWVTLGSELPDYDGMTCVAGGQKYRYSGQAQFRDQLKVDGELIEKLARRLLNTPYLWGGRTPLGIDCSGFTQLIYKCGGLQINRDAKDQALQGEVVDFVSASRSGDLAFFTKKSERISHVGIILPDANIIHASGRVRIDSIDHYGIFNNDIQQYTHRLKIIKRYF